MNKKLILAILLLGCMESCIAQTNINDTGKTFEHNISVQMNELIRQVFNFNNSATTSNANPYLVTYNINLKKTGWGLRVGVGYNYTSGTTDDGITKTTSNLNDLNFRFGIEKRFILSDKWSAGAGIDGVVQLNDDKTVAFVRQFDTTTTTTKSNITTTGAGPMAWLRYHVTKNIVIGTEASFYYTSGKQKNSTDISTVNPNTFPPVQTSSTSSNPTVTNGSFSLPVVFYLGVRF